MSETKTLQVMYDEKLVGTLAMASGHKVAFQYSEEWLEDGFSISPFSLPLKNQVFVPQKDYFDGLFGVFADSLPDNWGPIILSGHWNKQMEIQTWMNWQNNVRKFSIQNIQIN